MPVIDVQFAVGNAGATGPTGPVGGTGDLWR
jgi:hypothetical protein